jgi:hypothetical protein
MWIDGRAATVQRRVAVHAPDFHQQARVNEVLGFGIVGESGMNRSRRPVVRPPGEH